MLLGLLLILPVSRSLSGERRLREALRAPRPSRQTVAAALRSADPSLVTLGLECLGRLPPTSVEAILAEAPFGRRGPLDSLAPPLLRRRGDAMARRCLSRIQTER